MKKLAKLFLLVVVMGAIAGIAIMLRAKRTERGVTIDEWPDVPHNLAA